MAKGIQKVCEEKEGYHSRVKPYMLGSVFIN